MNPILFVSDSKRYQAILTALRDLGLRTERTSFAGVISAIATNALFSAFVLEWDSRWLARTKILERLRKSRPDIPILILCRDSDPELSYVQDIQSIATSLAMTGNEEEDFIRLLDALKALLPELRSEVLTVKDLLLIKTPSGKMKEVFTLVDILKDESSNVLIQGENGTGKEIVARLIHFTGRRYAGQFVAMNCAAIPENLLESELFGHEKGAFTGAAEKRIGKFELAHKGTAFLDEIGDMPLPTQAKILRVLEMGEIERLGGHEKIKVDIRIIAATNQNLLERMEQGLFRQDLYYRINTFTINLPPLRERREDILPLAEHFLDLFAASRGKNSKKVLSPEVRELLLGHDWPGNVRELRNSMERAFVLTPGHTVEIEALPKEIWQDRVRFNRPSPTDGVGTQTPQNSPQPIIPLKDLERNAIIQALSQLKNNATQAAKLLGISKATLFRKLKRYRIQRLSTLNTSEEPQPQDS